MLAGQIYEPGKVQLIDVADPPRLDDSGTAQILFAPRLACLCGSDLPFLRMEPPGGLPVELGHSLHEMIGTVVETTGRRFQAGETVLCVPTRQRGLWERFWEAETRAVAIETGLSAEQAVLSQPLGTVICALRKVDSLVDLDVVIIGQGPMGQLFTAAVACLGARRIVAVDRLGERLSASARMGATHAVDAENQDPVAELQRITAGRMADLVVVAVNHIDDAGAVYNDAVNLCREHGRILLFGLPQSQPEFDWYHFFRKNISLITSVGPEFELDFPLAMQWIAQGRIDVSPLITHHFPLAEIQSAFDTFCGRQEAALKVFVEFP